MNYGLNLEKEKLDQSEKDWVFGAASLACVATIADADRVVYLPIGEVQKGQEDFMDCASRGPLNILEMKLNWLLRNGKLPAVHEAFFRKNGYITKNGFELSDAFVAINSGTTRQGNSLKAPLEAIRTQGIIPKSMLPAGPDMTWAEYHDPARITDTMRELGKRSLEYLTINYERVREVDYEQLLIYDALNTAGYAWPEPEGGIYPRTEQDPNHCFMTVAHCVAFDNYIEDDSYLKYLAPDYNFLDYGYRLFISALTEPKKKTIVDYVRELIKRACYAMPITLSTIFNEARTHRHIQHTTGALSCI